MTDVARHTAECLERTRTSLHDNLLEDWAGDTKLDSPFWAKLDEQVADALADRMFCAEHGCLEQDTADDADDCGICTGNPNGCDYCDRDADAEAVRLLELELNR